MLNLFSYLFITWHLLRRQDKGPKFHQVYKTIEYRDRINSRTHTLPRVDRVNNTRVFRDILRVFALPCLVHVLYILEHRSKFRQAKKFPKRKGKKCLLMIFYSKYNMYFLKRNYRYYHTWHSGTLGRPNAQTTVQTPPGYDSEQYPGNPGQVTSCLFSRSRWIAEKKYKIYNR